jgi:hypothetical protein
MVVEEKIPRAIEGHYITAIEAHQGCERFPALPRGQHALEDGAERLGDHRIEWRAHLRVARDPLDPVEGVPIARCPFLVQSEERRGVEGNHGAGGQQCIA